MGRADQDHREERYDVILATKQELDDFAEAALMDLLDEAAEHTKRFLRGTRRWVSDVSHEKLALRWGYELVERFLIQAETELPCRPFLLLDSLVAKLFSQPEPFYYHEDVLSPLGRFLDGLISRAVVSRDALAALFYHLYGFGQAQVSSLLGLGAAESQRIYKNFERWREGGWQRMVEEVGTTATDLAHMEDSKRRQPERLAREAGRILLRLQAHYRKSEPQHYPCLSRARWADLCHGNYGYDYRAWHLAFCHDCLGGVCRLLSIPSERAGEGTTLLLDLHVRPLPKGGPLTFLFAARGRAPEGQPPVAIRRGRGLPADGTLAGLNSALTKARSSTHR